jgi:HK97 family phage prohead protease
MEADFSGYATKAGLKCSDGRTIMPDAFKHQDTMKVPLVWQHGHNDPENVLGHVLLENRKDGVYAYGFFNNSPKAKHAHGLLEHKDITQMSIWANDLIERAKKVLHGAIREVSLVLSGANPGALIENVTIRHGDMDEELEDEAIIFTGLPLEIEHSNGGGGDRDSGNTPAEGDTKSEDQPDEEDTTVQDVLDSMTDEQKKVVHSLVGKALQHQEWFYCGC